MALCFGADLAGGGRGLQNAEIKTARCFGQTAIEQNQSEQQNKTAERKVDRDFPRGRLSIAASPNSNEQECGNERELVKCIKEKQVDRCEGANCACGNEKQTGIECVFVFRNFGGEPDRTERNDRGKKQHQETEPIGAKREPPSPRLTNAPRANELKTARVAIEIQEKKKRADQFNRARNNCCSPCRRAE